MVCNSRYGSHIGSRLEYHIIQYLKSILNLFIDFLTNENLLFNTKFKLLSAIVMEIWSKYGQRRPSWQPSWISQIAQDGFLRNQAKFSL